MSSFVNTEFSTSVSGVAANFITPYHADVTKVSGNVLTTIASGAAVLHAIIPSAISGSQATFSGLRITVNNATSGMGATQSGITIWNYSFGLHSGLLTGGTTERPDSVIGIDAVCRSGIVVQGAVGWDVTIVYTKGT